MNSLEIIVLVETIAAVLILVLMVAMTTSIVERKKRDEKLYDPYNLYMPITAEYLAGMDEAAVVVIAEAAQLRKDASGKKCDGRRD